MPMTTDQKLADIDNRLKRWRPRLTRASREVAKLLRQRERVMKTKVNEAVPRAAETMAERLHQAEPSIPLEQAVRMADGYDKIEKAAAALVETPLDIPDFLQRGQAAQAAVNQVIADHNNKQLVETLKERRAKKTEDDKHKMPLTGRAAMDHIKRRK